MKKAKRAKEGKSRTIPEEVNEMRTGIQDSLG